MSDDTPAASPTDPPRRRRIRYRGTHPRRFEEKYKEHAPERFPDEVEKAIERGGAPAGTHLPVMLEEVVAALAPQAGATIADVTLGYGGHAAALGCLVGASGRIIGLDRDAEEQVRTSARLIAEGLPLTACHANYSALAHELRTLGIVALDGVLADLGCSSMQLDRPDRGFSFKNDGPLDLRMDRSRDEPATQWLESNDRTEIARVLTEYGDEPDADAIAREIRRRLHLGTPVTTTWELVATVLAAKGLPGPRWRRPDAFTPHPAARTFQALRIVVNREKEHLAAFLRDLPWVVRPGGRIAILTFHQGEERPVQEALAEGVRNGWWTDVPAEPARPTREETRRNPRSRSARLWTATRTE